MNRPRWIGNVRQWQTLLGREFRLLLGDPASVVWLLVLPLLIGSACRMALPLERDATVLVFLAVIAMIWLGMNFAALAIVGEWPVFRREAQVGLGVGAYLGAKTALLAAVAAVQAVLMMVPLGLVPAVLSGVDTVTVAHSAGQVMRLLLILLFCGLAGGVWGLLISAVARTATVASLLVPLVVLAQLVFSAPVARSDKVNYSELYAQDFAWSRDDGHGKPVADTAARLSYPTISRWAHSALHVHVTHSASDTAQADAVPTARWLPPLLVTGALPLALAWVVLRCRTRGWRGLWPASPDVSDRGGAAVDQSA